MGDMRILLGRFYLNGNTSEIGGQTIKIAKSMLGSVQDNGTTFSPPVADLGEGPRGPALSYF